MSGKKLKTSGDVQLPREAQSHTVETVTQEIIRKIKTPLSLIRGRAEKLKGQLQFDQKENTQAILDQVQRLEELMGVVEGFVHANEAPASHCKLHDLFQDVTLFFQLRISQAQIHVMNLVPKELELEIDGPHLRQVLMDLLIESIKSLESAKQEQKNIFFHYQVSKTHRIISIENNSYKSVSDLVQLKKTVEAHGWSFKVQGQVQKGTRFDICVPL